MLVRGRATSCSQQAEPYRVDKGNTGVAVLFGCAPNYCYLAVLSKQKIGKCDSGSLGKTYGASDAHGFTFRVRSSGATYFGDDCSPGAAPFTLSLKLVTQGTLG